ncbi:hypothetical protein DFQ26_006529 [Actinomortierella ambigua]|nr:hypothetical protein DFQ26_006529 [Actinomortierella ambigua]
MPTLAPSLNISWIDFGGINIDIPDQVHTDIRTNPHMSRPQVVSVYIANSLSVFGSGVILIMARCIMRAVPSHRSRLWLITATALSNFGFALANLITDLADTTTTLPCVFSAWCYIFFQLLTCTLVIVSTFRLCGTFLFKHSHRIPNWTIALCPSIAFILATVPAAASQFDFDACAQYCWYKVEQNPPECTNRSAWSWVTFYGWMIIFLSTLFFSTILVLLKIIRMRARSRAELRRFNRHSASTLATLSCADDPESGRPHSLTGAHRLPAWNFWKKPSSQTAVRGTHPNANTGASATATTTPEFITGLPAGLAAQYEGTNHDDNADTNTSTTTTTGVRSLSAISPRQNALDMAAALAQRREAEYWFLFAILRQALYPITITASGCIQIFVDLTLNDETAKRSTFETAATVATSIQGFLFFFVFLFDPAVAQWRRMWKEYAVWKWYVEFYFSLGMPQEGKDFEDQFLANCHEHLDKDPSLARFLRPPAYAWSCSYQRYLATNQQTTSQPTESHLTSRETSLPTLSTTHGSPSGGGGGATAATTNAAIASNAASQTLIGTAGHTNQGTQPEAIMLEMGDPDKVSPVEMPLSSETTPMGGPVLPATDTSAPIDAANYTLNTSTPLAALPSKQQPPPPSPPPSFAPPHMTSLEGSDGTITNDGKRRSWLHCGAATTLHPLSEDEEGKSMDDGEHGLPAAALSPFRAPAETPSPSTKNSKPRYIRQYAQQLLRAVSSNNNNNNSSSGTQNDNDNNNSNIAEPTPADNRQGRQGGLQGLQAEKGEEGSSGGGVAGSSHPSSQDMSEKHIILPPEVVGYDHHGHGPGHGHGAHGPGFPIGGEEEEDGEGGEKHATKSSRLSIERRTTIGGGDITHNPFLTVHRTQMMSLAGSTDSGITIRSPTRRAGPWWGWCCCCCVTCTPAEGDDEVVRTTAAMHNNAVAVANPTTARATGAAAPNTAALVQFEGNERGPSCASGATDGSGSSSSAGARASGGGGGGGRGSTRPSQHSNKTLFIMDCCGHRRKFSRRNDRRNTPEINIVYQKPFRSLYLAYFVHNLVRYLLVPRRARLPRIPFPRNEVSKSVRARQASVDLVAAGLWEPHA